MVDVVLNGASAKIRIKITILQEIKKIKMTILRNEAKSEPGVYAQKDQDVLCLPVYMAQFLG